MPELFDPAPEPVSELGRFRILSTTSSLRVSPLALGAMSIGDAWNDFMGSMDKEAAFKLLDGYVAKGGNFIDTANNYQNEQSETWLGEWMTARQNRDQIVIATKFTSDYRCYAVGKNKSPNNSGNGRRSMRNSLKDSLRKLQTDYVDIFYLHWWDYSTSIPEIMDGLHALVQSGQVMYLGVSDTPAWLVSAANTYAEAHGKTPFSIYQGRWNVMIRDMERDIIPMARHFGMAIAPWDVLGGGKLQSKAAMAKRAAQGEGLRTLFDTPTAGQQSAEELAFSEALDKVAGEHGVTSVTTIALAFVLSKAPRVFPVLGGRKIEHWDDNIRALTIKLTDEQIEYLESVKPFDYGFPHDFTGRDPLITGVSTGQVAMGSKVDYSQPLTRRI